jgi:hypothetical protein
MVASGTRRALMARAVEESQAVGGKHADFSQQVCQWLRWDGGGRVDRDQRIKVVHWSQGPQGPEVPSRLASTERGPPAGS